LKNRTETTVQARLKRA